MQQILSDQTPINSAEGIRLCAGQPDLYYRLLSCFPDDSSMSNLEKSLVMGDVQEAFRHAHTLKGLSAQLALPALYQDACILCDLLKSSDPQNLQNARQMLPLLTADYHAVLQKIHFLTMEHLP